MIQEVDATPEAPVSVSDCDKIAAGEGDIVRCLRIKVATRGKLVFKQTGFFYL